MSVIWLFDSTNKTTNKASISGQLQSISDRLLILYNPWVTDSVFMGKLYTAMTICTALYAYPDLINVRANSSIPGFYAFTIMQIIYPLIFVPFLAYRIFLIKNLSSIYLNRNTKKLYYKRVKTLIVFDWNNTAGGLFKRTEFGGASFSTSYALAFAPRRADGTLNKKYCLWIDSNEPTEPGIKHVGEVWEYLCQFMEHGPAKLPPPNEPNWWYRPLYAICLTPAEAWRHYAPWRTGEPGEMQGKKLWQLPFWAVLFPYNITLAIAWYGICRLFNVRAAAAPAEAFEEAPASPRKPKGRPVNAKPKH